MQGKMISKNLLTTIATVSLSMFGLGHAFGNGSNLLSVASAFAENSPLKSDAASEIRKPVAQPDTVILAKDTTPPPPPVFLTDSVVYKPGPQRRVERRMRKKRDTAIVDYSLPAWRRIMNDTLTVQGGRLPQIRPEQMVDTSLLRLTEQQVEPEKVESEQARERSNLFRDTIPISRMTLLSVAIPGFSQFYNRDYWKIPVLYGTVGGFTTLGLYTNNKYKKAKNLYDQAVYANLDGTTVARRQRDMNRYNTQRTLFMAGAIASYLYFLGDGVVNYKGHATDVKKATTLAMIFPGAGQAYNRSYWKIPIVYGGFATFAYVIDFNNRGYQRYKKAYNDVTNGLPDEFNGRYSAALLKNTRDSFRRYRDLAIIYTCGFYLLTIIDAHVEAYLKRYDISDNLSMRIGPSYFENQYRTASSVSGGKNTYGMSLKINF